MPQEERSGSETFRVFFLMRSLEGIALETDRDVEMFPSHKCGSMFLSFSLPPGAPLQYPCVRAQLAIFELVRTVHGLVGIVNVSGLSVVLTCVLDHLAISTCKS